MATQKQHHDRPAVVYLSKRRRCPFCDCQITCPHCETPMKSRGLLSVMDDMFVAKVYTCACGFGTAHGLLDDTAHPDYKLLCAEFERNGEVSNEFLTELLAVPETVVKKRTTRRSSRPRKEQIDYDTEYT